MAEREPPKDENVGGNGGKEGGEEYLKDQRMILRTLNNLETQVAALTRELIDFRLDTKTSFGVINTDIREVKVRSTLFGTIGGIFSGALVGIAALFKRP